MRGKGVPRLPPCQVTLTQVHTRDKCTEKVVTFVTVVHKRSVLWLYHRSLPPVSHHRGRCFV